MLQLFLYLICVKYDVPAVHYFDIKRVELREENLPGYAGVYEDGVIYLYKGSSEYTLIHEVGHHVHKKYKDQIDNSVFGVFPFMNTYARVNANEDFAVTYTEYFMGDKCNHKLFKKKCDQIKHISE